MVLPLPRNNKTMKVIKLLTESEAEAGNYPESVGLIGGWFSNGHRWPHYEIHIEGRAGEQYIYALRAYILENKVWIGGDQHQYEGVPLFEDGTIALLSYRAWGDLMAAVWSTELNRDFNYMDFYMGCRMAEPPAEWNK